MDKNLFSKNNHLLLTGANSVALVALSGFLIKKLNEKDMELEELRVEFSNLHKIVKENNIRTNNLFKTIKLEQEHNNNKNHNLLRQIESKIPNPKIEMGAMNERNFENVKKQKQVLIEEVNENLIDFEINEKEKKEEREERGERGERKENEEIKNEQDVLNILRS